MEKENIYNFLDIIVQGVLPSMDYNKLKGLNGYKSKDEGVVIYWLDGEEKVITYEVFMKDLFNIGFNNYLKYYPLGIEWEVDKEFMDKIKKEGPGFLEDLLIN